MRRKLKLIFILSIIPLSIGILLRFSILDTPEPFAAILDTGASHDWLSPENDRVIRLKKDGSYGWNFFGGNADVTDKNGHGTKVAKAFWQVAPEKKVLFVKITENKAGVLPTDLARALNFAADNGASLIQLAFGLTSGNDELEAAITKLQDKGVVLVLAAGAGAVNPFESVALDHLYPHAYGRALVVGSRVSEADPDPFSNFGKLLDFNVTPGFEGSYLSSGERAYGSSFASAWISGWIMRQKLYQSKSTVDYAQLKKRVLESLSPFAFSAKNVRGEIEPNVDGEMDETNPA